MVGSWKISVIITIADINLYILNFVNDEEDPTY